MALCAYRSRKVADDSLHTSAPQPLPKKDGDGLLLTNIEGLMSVGDGAGEVQQQNISSTVVEEKLGALQTLTSFLILLMDLDFIILPTPPRYSTLHARIRMQQMPRLPNVLTCISWVTGGDVSLPHAVT